MVRKLSGLQREVVHLYRSCIRMAHTKPIENRPHFIKYIHSEFGKYKDIPRKDFTTIEHLLRIGSKKLQEFSKNEVKDIR
ncbi:hypothetical protein Kpol_1062p13 [Vanderwaltozyma polyspora DSM 70294]|uniref:Complex 1 LYR protein domain-containing protein n=1 Tax=Vanderwaltozyma polyspora (strain ATCC 22028 / DSM 70294 / BCRC 21397 / CBS 2163 / NBRC 10782 / NRRL Y-8283 / UCD 57-17) TaxID=436907 RepID=A7TK70_VANPO|nr:uncharacterized protein Kpol_1062p13 [Vanderwaltozyma polyspora DSM 70294]EDO17305.1 hypothetical protein Kpol_1062p13 [Vanderwaltozyma polyspora DSM 70294]